MIIIIHFLVGLIYTSYAFLTIYTHIIFAWLCALSTLHAYADPPFSLYILGAAKAAVDFGFAICGAQACIG